MQINKHKKSLTNVKLFYVTQSGFEPETYCLEGSCSIQLSYWAKIDNSKNLSGWQDSNLRPPAPKAGAITGLRYTPRTKKAERQGLEPWRQLPVDRLAICSITTLAPLLFCKELNLFCGCKCRVSNHYYQLFF